MSRHFPSSIVQLTIDPFLEETIAMNRVIELVVSPQGEVTVETKGYTGSDCVKASRFLEKALGTPVSERKTAEYYQTVPTEQHVRH